MVIPIPQAFPDRPEVGDGGATSKLPSDHEVREFLARELHDTVANLLSEMILEMECLKRRTVDSSLHDEFGLLQSSTREVLQNLRPLLSALRDEPTHVCGFADMVRQTLERFQRESGIQATLMADDGWPRRMAGRTAHHLLRIVEEGLRNVRRQGSARSVQVTLVRLGDAVVLTVHDDGPVLQGVPEGRGYGIRGMQECAVLAGGDLCVESFPDYGTAVQVSLPLERV